MIYKLDEKKTACKFILKYLKFLDLSLPLTTSHMGVCSSSNGVVPGDRADCAEAWQETVAWHSELDGFISGT